MHAASTVRSHLNHFWGLNRFAAHDGRLGESRHRSYVSTFYPARSNRIKIFYDLHIIGNLNAPSNVRLLPCLAVITCGTFLACPSEATVIDPPVIIVQAYST